MPEIVLDLLKYFFLLLLFIFLARAVKAMYIEVAGPRSQRASRAPTPKAVPKQRARPPSQLVIVSPDSQSQTYDIGDELIIGRDSKCHAVINDTYASQVHARIFRKDDQMFIEDMGSTNGTYLSRRKVTSPTPVSRGDTARIGKTTLEFKR